MKKLLIISSLVIISQANGMSSDRLYEIEQAKLELQRAQLCVEILKHKYDTANFDSVAGGSPYISSEARTYLDLFLKKHHKKLAQNSPSESAPVSRQKPY
ncbi:MAG TPA: hypothetical protein PLU71_03075 [Candidatus Dependentiae bacterium]|nr:hypothetical protein [Candidatus Dependentiae bacterium]HRQ62814.1 hypothetical protein [Candidatus Dependentiae bacterium]